MPQKRSNQPPEVMTWGKATPVLVIAVLFDALRLLFEWFWFFGPALAAIACTLGVNSFFGISIAGVVGKVVAAGCTVAAGVVGVASLEVSATFGTVMAMAVGFMGWLTVGIILLATNARIFKENLLWFVGALLISEVPIVGSIPAITIAVWRMYSQQIKTEKAALAKWKKGNAQAQLQERNQQAAQIMQIQAIQQAQFEQEQAANAEQFAEEEIPDEAQEVA
jgi:hypothetical protein